MKIDTQELQRVAAAEQPRFDIYAFIHKALRAYMTDTLLALGRADVEDDVALQAAAGQVVALADFCRSHLAHENAWVHPAIEARAAGASAAIAHDHEHHEAEIDGLRADAQALCGLPADARAASAHALYRRLALFVGDNFRHMEVEESENTLQLLRNRRSTSGAAVGARSCAGAGVTAASASGACSRSIAAPRWPAIVTSTSSSS